MVITPIQCRRRPRGSRKSKKIPMKYFRNVSAILRTQQEGGEWKIYRSGKMQLIAFAILRRKQKLSQISPGGKLKSTQNSELSAAPLMAQPLLCHGGHDDIHRRENNVQHHDP
ncbi:hypothetical protein RIN58_09795 [Siccibacter colletis]|uniref:hypothetical protein n=1 Tax=Siccibacter colletis TaxID=1505757 RepID=UPI0028BE57F8|nr:hypothetical protein [Siccibacter colletis]WNN50356.1 hypothetical protein RIN58_09795 [Siccibacter colletis]